MVLHQLVDCALGSTRCGIIFRTGFWFVFGGMQATHECSPVWLDDFGRAEVEQLLDENEHARAGKCQYSIIA